jgi:hypothetical protein
MLRCVNYTFLMFNLKNITVGLFFALSASSAFAGDPQRILLIQTDDAPGNTYIDIAQAADGSLSSLVYETDPPLPPFTFAQLQANPAVLKQKSGKDAVILKLEQPFDPIHGGHVIVQYLNNGINNGYKDFRILIDVQGSTITFRSDPDSTDPQSDNNTYTSVFNQLFMYKRSILGKEIGIDHVTPSQVAATDVTNGPAPIPDPSEQKLRVKALKN